MDERELAASHEMVKVIDLKTSKDTLAPSLHIMMPGGIRDQASANCTLHWRPFNRERY